MSLYPKGYCRSSWIIEPCEVGEIDLVVQGLDGPWVVAAGHVSGGEVTHEQ